LSQKLCDSGICEKENGNFGITLCQLFIWKLKFLVIFPVWRYCESGRDALCAEFSVSFYPFFLANPNFNPKILPQGDVSNECEMWLEVNIV
jgi:hypothetical protein